MKNLVLFGFLLFFSTPSVFGQYLKEQEWTTLSNYKKSNDNTGFEAFLKKRGFSKSDQTNDKYVFYNWKKTDSFYYGVRVNSKSGQVTYMTNDQNYVLKLLSRFVSEYSHIKSEKQGTLAMTHIFQSQTSTIAVKLDLSTDSGTHLLFASNN
ncbi:hypothetical protein [Aquimarina sp. AU119]|uniref:hypothetical protein n=1 Tax=Aquimarina sp. AU119 TaxID=2108528 RepID=UPI000D69F2B3|nr:hypothetical protein [Aquimarina sp. AU119]